MLKKFLATACASVLVTAVAGCGSEPNISFPAKIPTEGQFVIVTSDMFADKGTIYDLAGDGKVLSTSNFQGTDVRFQSRADGKVLLGGARSSNFFVVDSGGTLTKSHFGPKGDYGGSDALWVKGGKALMTAANGGTTRTGYLSPLHIQSPDGQVSKSVEHTSFVAAMSHLGENALLAGSKGDNGTISLVAKATLQHVKSYTVNDVMTVYKCFGLTPTSLRCLDSGPRPDDSKETQGDSPEMRTAISTFDLESGTRVQEGDLPGGFFNMFQHGDKTLAVTSAGLFDVTSGKPAPIYKFSGTGTGCSQHWVEGNFVHLLVRDDFTSGPGGSQMPGHIVTIDLSTRAVTKKTPLKLGDRPVDQIQFIPKSFFSTS